MSSTLSTAAVKAGDDVEAPGGDELRAALNFVREARQVPWDSSWPGAWRGFLLHALGSAQGGLLAYSVRMSGAWDPGSATPGGCGSREWRAAQRHYEEQRALLGACIELVRQVEGCRAERLDHVVRAAESMVRLEMRLAAHLRQFRELPARRVATAPPDTSDSCGACGAATAPGPSRRAAPRVSSRTRLALGGD